MKTAQSLAVLVFISLLFGIMPSLTDARQTKNSSAISLPSIAKLGIDLNGAYYRASGNQIIAGNEQIRGVHPFECVEFVYGRAIERGLFKNGRGIGTVLNGDAHTWDDRIANSTYRNRLSRKVKVNSVVVWEADLKFTWQEGNTTYSYATDPIAGHVAFVEKVYPDGSFLISEGNHVAQPLIKLIKAKTPVAKAAKFIYL
ncbi:CHAP domain-containing protein [Chamaesiphon sp. VAR_48_metabat_403]|uniref:CHAP domain-containing protein n=1 Tax=Chamaesiphon sp. VAR_48_metabat_403 TaxID=2964700 RepID=UPI00286E7DAA|nr:CHAP domain-containing protein [Chamaesiphon sp. VAR_48_metabat_403]